MGGGVSRAGEDPENKRFGLGVSTPREMVLLLEKLERGEVVSPEASKEMIGILKRQQYHEGIGRTLKGVELATKPGALDALRSGRIVDTPRGRLAIRSPSTQAQPFWSVYNPGPCHLQLLGDLVDGLARHDIRRPGVSRGPARRGDGDSACPRPPPPDRARELSARRNRRAPRREALPELAPPGPTLPPSVERFDGRL